MITEQDSMTIKHHHKMKKGRRRLERLWWAVTLIWAGLVLGADAMGLVPQIGEASVWNWIFLGAGLVAVLGSAVRQISADIPNPTTWDWIWGGICLVFGLDGFVMLNIFWPLVLILVGGLAIVNGLWLRA